MHAYALLLMLAVGLSHASAGVASEGLNRRDEVPSGSSPGAVPPPPVSSGGDGDSSLAYQGTMPNGPTTSPIEQNPENSAAQNPGGGGPLAPGANALPPLSSGGVATPAPSLGGNAAGAVGLSPGNSFGSVNQSGPYAGASGAPLVNGTAVSPTSQLPASGFPSGQVPGDTSSGQCMCPAPTCGAAPVPINGTLTSPTSEAPPSPSSSPAVTLPSPGNGNGTESAANMLITAVEGKLVTGLITLGLTVFAL